MGAWPVFKLYSNCILFFNGHRVSLHEKHARRLRHMLPVSNNNNIDMVSDDFKFLPQRAENFLEDGFLYSTRVAYIEKFLGQKTQPFAATGTCGRTTTFIYASERSSTPTISYWHDVHGMLRGEKYRTD